LGSYTLIVAPMRVKFGTVESTPPCQNYPLRNLNTGTLRCAQCCW